MRVTRKCEIGVLAVALIAMAIWAVVPEHASVSAKGSSRLVSIQHLPEGDVCDWDTPSSEHENLLAEQQWSGSPLMASLPMGALFAAVQQRGQASSAAGPLANKTLTPLRTIRDLDPGYSAIAVDVRTDEVILQDNNLWSYRVFNRMDNTPPAARFTEPKRIVQGDKTELQFNNGLYVDPKTSEIYSVESDTGDKMVVFSNDSKGNVPPKRILHTAHRIYNLAVDEEKEELFATIEYPSEVMVYDKHMGGEDLPIRRLSGDRTGLDAPHGIAVDEKNQLLYVNTWGHHSNFTTPGTGRYDMPAIKVYPLYASGNMAPLRVIQGDKTQLDWPAAMKLNPETGELYVANDIGQSILVFRNIATAQGNVAPLRVITGSKTRLRNPTGVALDLKNHEVWVSNLGNASATVYPLMADGDVAPLRVIRSAPEGKKSLLFGRTTAVAYDPTREQILTPN